MKPINIHQAKTHLSRLVEQVMGGEEIVIAKRGRPVAKLVRFPSEPRKPGRLEGKIHMAPDFEDPKKDGAGLETPAMVKVHQVRKIFCASGGKTSLPRTTPL